MKLSPSIEALIEGLRHLPGVGPKSAQRMTLHLLERDREGAQQIAEAIEVALSKVKNCSFRGHYYVLMGHLSPIDGIGPEQLGLEALCQRFAYGEIEEVILATNPTVEGEATAYYISERARAAAVTVSRIAHGVPLGGELEYTDANTLAHALSGRTVVGE